MNEFMSRDKTLNPLRFSPRLRRVSEIEPPLHQIVVAAVRENGNNRCRPDLNRGFHAEAGFVLHMAFMMLLAVSAVGGFLLYAAYNHSNTVRRWHAADQCLLDAQSALEQVKYELVQSWLANQVSSAGSLGWFQAWNINTIGSNPVYNIPALGPINGSAVAVTIANVNIVTNSGYADVELIGAAGRSAPYVVTRLIQETLRIFAAGTKDTQVFDYAYFINNHGELGGGDMVINGDVRANGNFTFSSKPVVNGNIYASGSINNKINNWPWKNYWKKTMSQARPTDPTDKSSANAWPMGYDYSHVNKNAQVPALTMPSIGDVDQLASTVNGTVSQNGANIVVNVYEGAGPDGIAGTADDNCLVLSGSSSKPVIISGAVVVKGDVIIRGKIDGQGTIYSGRNIHIVGDLSYLNPPAWPKPDSNPAQTAAKNRTRDLLVLAAKGNIVVGDYTSKTWKKRVLGIMKDSANITPYNVDASDAVLGYDSDNNAANGYLFEGRYYLDEANNGRRLSGAGANTVPRKYYESSLANSTFNSLCSADVPSINAALFSNHGIIGNFGASSSGGNTTLNGAMVCHDDLYNYDGSFTLNWDIRLGSASNERINTRFLSGSGGTGATATVTTIGWREIH